MKRPAPKADFLEHTWRVYCVMHRRARGGGSGAFDTTWKQLAKAAGYPDDSNTLRQLQRYAAILTELGLVRVAGARDSAGRWQRLDVELLPVASDGHEAAPGAAEPHRAPAVPDALVWRVHRLSDREQGLLDDVCQGARAGRLPRRLAPRLHRISNLRTPERGVKGFALSPSRAALRERAHGGRPAAGPGMTRSSAEQGATPTGCADDGCAGWPRSAAAGTPLGGVVSLDAVQSSLIRAVLIEGPAGLPAAAAAALRDADPAVVVEAAWRAVHGSRGAALNPERRRQLGVALARLDRFALFGAGQAGAGVQLAVERIVADLDEPDGERFHRLGGLVAWLRSESSSWRRGAAARAGRPMLPPKPLPDRQRRRPTGGAWEWPTDDAW